MDFPGNIVTATHFHTYGFGGGVTEARGIGSQTNAGNITWPSANRAIYHPMFLAYPYPVNRVFWVNGSTGGGNVDFGIYTPGGTRIYSTGSTAQSGTDTTQYVTPSTTFTLAPGRYFFALACSGTTGAVYGTVSLAVESLRFSGALQESSALPLPATATFAAVSSSAAAFCGVTRTTTGY